MSAKRIVVLAIALGVCLIALASIASAQAFLPAPPVQDQSVAWVAAGGGYRVTALAWPRCVSLAETSALAGGGQYRLWSPALVGSGCCRTFLPCTVRGSK